MLIRLRPGWQRPGVAEGRSEAPAQVVKTASTEFWQAVNRSGVLQRRWDDEAVVLSSGSGATHLLSSDASKVLSVLIEARTPLSVANISGTLSAPSGTESFQADPEVDAAVSTILHELQRIGLVQVETP
jgi:PqqD family protein of HPr-rel-A system